jgi:hypothetical protein
MLFQTSIQIELDELYRCLCQQIVNEIECCDEQDDTNDKLKASQSVLNLANALRVINEVDRGR